MHVILVQEGYLFVSQVSVKDKLKWVCPRWPSERVWCWFEPNVAVAAVPRNGTLPLDLHTLMMMWLCSKLDQECHLNEVLNLPKWNTDLFNQLISPVQVTGCAAAQVKANERCQMLARAGKTLPFQLCLKSCHSLNQLRKCIFLLKQYRSTLLMQILKLLLYYSKSALSCWSEEGGSCKQPFRSGC